MSRRLGGSLGVPHRGHWPLGLGWDILHEYHQPLAEDVTSTRSVIRRKEQDRKSILMDHDEHNCDRDQVSAEKRDLDEIRTTRKINMFCSCHSRSMRIQTRLSSQELKKTGIVVGGSNVQKVCSIARADSSGHYCQCAQAGLPCHKGICSCDCDCKNPFGEVVRDELSLKRRREDMLKKANAELGVDTDLYDFLNK